MELFRGSLLLVGIVCLLAISTTVASAQSDPVKVLIGRWEGTVSDPIRNFAKVRTLIIRSVEPTESGWVAKGSFRSGGRETGGAIRNGIDVSLKDGLIVLQFSTVQGPWRFVLTGDNRLEGSVYYQQYKGQGIVMRTLRLSLEKKALTRDHEPRAAGHAEAV